MSGIFYEYGNFPLIFFPNLHFLTHLKIQSVDT